MEHTLSLATLAISTPKPIWQQGWQGNYEIHPQYPQYFPQYPPYPTPCYPYHSPPPQPQPQPHPSQIYTLTQLPIPPFPNPHIELAQPTYNVEVQHFQTSPLELNGIHHSSGRVLQKRDYLDIIEGSHPEEEDSNEKTKESWAALDEEKTSKLEIEKAPLWLSSNPPCIQENNQKKEEDFKVMVQEDMKKDPDKQSNQGHESYIEVWFQTVTKFQQHSLLQLHLMSSNSKHLITPI